MKVGALVVFGVLMSFGVSAGCTRSLSVRVVDAETGAPVPGATVEGSMYSGLFMMAPPSAVTGPDGVATLRAPADGLRHVSAYADDYQHSVRGPSPGDADARPVPTLALWRKPEFTVEYRVPQGYRGAFRVREVEGCLPADRAVVVRVSPPAVAENPTAGLAVFRYQFSYDDGTPIPMKPTADEVGVRGSEELYRLRGAGDARVYFIGTQRELDALDQLIAPP